MNFINRDAKRATILDFITGSRLPRHPTFSTQLHPSSVTMYVFQCFSNRMILL